MHGHTVRTEELGRLAYGRWPLFFGLVFVLVSSPALCEEHPKHASTGSPQAVATGKPLPTYATPVDVYRAYLNAVKKNDLVAAKECWWLAGKDTSALDVIAGMWVASHRVNAAFGKAGIDRKQFGGEFARDDCTDTTIDRTLRRLEHSTFVVNGDTAKLTIRWDKDDGYPNTVFWYSNDPIPLRKVGVGWRMDALAMCGIAKPEDFFKEGGWGIMFRNGMEMMNEVAAGLESGKLKTANDVVQALEKQVGSLEGRIPLTQTVIYLEDSPTRYMRIRKGDPNVTSIGPEQLPHRKDIAFPRRVEGDVRTVFTEIYGVDHPKIVVETKNAKGYEVVFDPKDPKAMEIVAKQLGMTVSQDEREILALQITVAKGGHHLKQVPKPDTPQWDCCVTDKTPEGTERHWVWPLHGVSMDELALFLESRFGRPVVNRSGLAAYYSLDLSDETVRLWPQEVEQTKALDQTGLLLRWERTRTRVLVVKDK